MEGPRDRRTERWRQCYVDGYVDVIWMECKMDVVCGGWNARWR